MRYIPYELVFPLAPTVTKEEIILVILRIKTPNPVIFIVTVMPIPTPVHKFLF